MIFPHRIFAHGMLAIAMGVTALHAGNEDGDRSHAIRVLNQVFAQPEKVDWARDEKVFVDFATGYPESPDAKLLVSNFMYAYETAHTTGESAAAWSAFNGSPNAAVAQDAKAKANYFAFAKGPIELRFTAVDGRKVDLESLRGKVVLLDFWATWCPPCMAELPNVVKTYRQYHDKGFEIVGISCDVAPELAGAGAKSWAKSGPDLIAFTKVHDMPWPQSYEGRKHNEGGNTIAARFAVTGIPSALLIGKDGRIVAANVRGEALSDQVSRLLK